MHFHLDADTEVFREGVLTHLQEVMTPEFEERLYRSGVAHDDGFATGLSIRVTSPRAGQLKLADRTAPRGTSRCSRKS